MIILDIETSGVDFEKCGIWQIGAIDLDSGEEFVGECRIDNEDQILDDVESSKTVYEVIGKTERELREVNKQSQKELLGKFFLWAKERKIQICICQNPQFDLGFIFSKARKYNLKIEIHFRAFDLHSIAQMKYFGKEGKFNVDFEKKRFGFGLKEILEFCGLKDERTFHNALEDCKLEAECFSRLVYGKNLFPKYAKFPVPEELKK